MNPIKNIEIKNFKSIRHQKIDGCKRINVFIGYPNVGKSNILEAISLFGVNEEADIKDLVRVKEIPTIFFNGVIEDDLMVAFNDDYGVFGSVSENIFSLQFQGRDGDGAFQKIKLNAALNLAITKVIKYRDFGSRTGTQAVGVGPFTIKKYEFRKGISQNIGSYSSLQYPLGNNIFSILQTSKQLNKDARQLFKEYDLDLLYDSREQKFTILKRTDNGIFTVPYELVADTLQRLIFYKAAVNSNKETILLLEEPEAHMFPPYISKFTADAMYDKNDNQFFINTHSPFVINDLMENLKKEELSIYVVGYKKETGETVLRKLSDEELHEVYQFGIDLYMNLENFLIHEQQ